jgi:hypothetical protein
MGRAFAISMAVNFAGWPAGAAIAGWLATFSTDSAVLVGVVDVDAGLREFLGEMLEQAGFVGRFDEHHVGFAGVVAFGAKRIHDAQVIAGHQMNDAIGAFDPRAGGEDVDALVGDEPGEIGEDADLVADFDDDFLGGFGFQHGCLLSTFGRTGT